MFMKRFRRIIALFILAYVALFVVCLAWEYLTDGPRVQRHSGNVTMPSGAVGKKNYASAQYRLDSAAASGQVDQKYERTATVASRTKAFDDDEKKVRATISAYTGIIQYESGRGTRGQRALFLHIGIQPARFDDFYTEMQKIGTVQSMDITKTDKTNEYLTLKAKRISLEKNRAALMELKKRDGRIQELMALEEKILGIEQNLQSLGVALGEFDEVNAFCTVRFSLAEYAETIRTRGVLSYCKAAVLSATYLYVAFVALVFFISVVALIIMIVIDKFNLVRDIADKAEAAKNAAGPGQNTSGPGRE